MFSLREFAKFPTWLADFRSAVGDKVRFSFGWRRVLSAWALVLILILAGFAAVELAPSRCFAEAPGPHLQGARIPQYDPFDLGPPPFEHSRADVIDEQ